MDPDQIVVFCGFAPVLMGGIYSWRVCREHNRRIDSYVAEAEEHIERNRQDPSYSLPTFGELFKKHSLYPYD